MEQSSEESTSSDESEQNAPVKKTLPILAGDQKSIPGIQSESTNFISKEKSGWAQKKTNVENLEEIERGRSKSVGRYVRKSSKVSPEKLKRSKSMDRSGSENSREKSESSEREEKLTFFSMMTDKERNIFLRERLGLKPKYPSEEKYETKIKERKRKPRSRSRSRERRSHHGQKSRREESPKLKQSRRQSHSEWKGESRDKNQGYYDDQRHSERKQESREHRPFREQSSVMPNNEIPCKYFNDAGFCKYSSGHPDKLGNPKLHICAACFYDRGEKNPHSQLECFVVDESCMYYNNGDCKYKSGHLSLDGKYARHHICKICFIRGKKMPHSAIDCKYTNTKRRRDSPPRESLGNSGQKKPCSFRDHERYDEIPCSFSDQERYDETSSRFSVHERLDEKPRFSGHERLDEKPCNFSDHESHDEKPCTFFNNNGSCRFISGHYPGSGGFTKQIHVCSCCKEFLGKDEYHPSVDCRLKKRLTGGRRMDLNVSKGAMELPCNSFNSGKCVLKSGHRLLGETRFLHICKFCFEYRGEMKDHTQRACRVKKKLLHEIQSERLLNRKKKDARENEKEMTNDKRERNIRKKDINERMPTQYINGDNFTLNVKKTFKTVNLGEDQLKAKTSEVAKEHNMVSPYNQPTQVEQAINETKSNINEVVEQEIVLKTKDASIQGRDPRRRNLNKTEQETSNSTESNEEKLDSNVTKTILKDKDKEQSKENENSANASIHEQDSPLIEKNTSYQNADNKSTKKEGRLTKISLECYKKRRKLERSTPQAVIRSIDASEGCGNSREINEEKEKPRQEGLVPVENVLKNSNTDSKNENNESEILKKLEHLEKLHMIELENLRKVRQETTEVNGQT